MILKLVKLTATMESSIVDSWVVPKRVFGTQLCYLDGAVLLESYSGVVSLNQPTRDLLLLSDGRANLRMIQKRLQWSRKELINEIETLVESKILTLNFVCNCRG